jgi:tetratricopeptide (TPR) repeat protein
LGEEQKALDYYNQALPLERAVGDRATEAETLSRIGKVYADLAERQKALDYYNQGLLLRRAVGDRNGEGTTLSNIGALYADLGEKQKALDYYNRALPLARAVGNRTREAETLNLRAQVEGNGEAFSDARSDSEAALNLVETLRAGMASRELRASYLSTPKATTSSTSTY